jgi:hypothetical protein
MPLVTNQFARREATKRINCQMPAACHCRKRRQQVLPEPQAGSFVSISQGMPLRKTNGMLLK